MRSAETQPKILIVDDKPESLLATKYLLGKLDVRIIEWCLAAQKGRVFFWNLREGIYSTPKEMETKSCYGNLL